MSPVEIKHDLAVAVLIALIGWGGREYQRHIFISDSYNSFSKLCAPTISNDMIKGKLASILNGLSRLRGCL